MEQTIIIDIPEKIKEFLALPKGVYKNIMYNKINNGFQLVTYSRDGNNHYFSVTSSYVVKYGDNYLIKHKTKDGLSFKDNKLKIWYGKPIISIQYLSELFRIMNWNFIEREYMSYLTKTSLSNLFKGKITNTRELLSSYIKSVKFDCSPDLLYKTIRKRVLNKNEFYSFGKLAKNVNHFCVKWGDGSLHNNNNLQDICRQFDMLNKKIDYNWSIKRMNEEHNKATKIIMGIEIDHMNDEVINYPEIELPYGFEILNTQKQVFQECRLMNHCVYTNYWTSIKNGTYVAFHITFNQEEATLGCRLDATTREMKFSQVYRRGNISTSLELSQYCKDWINENNMIFKDFPYESTKYNTNNLQQVGQLRQIQEDIDWFAMPNL